MKYLSQITVTRLQNNNVLYNGREVPFADLPQPVILHLYQQENKMEFSNDDYLSLLGFFNYAQRNGYPFPSIPPKTLFDLHDQETTYYKYRKDRVKQEKKVKHKITQAEQAMLNLIRAFVKDNDLMGSREWNKIEKSWINELEGKTDILEYYTQEIIKDEDGKPEIDWSQQKRQNEVNRLIANFYKWLSDRTSN